MQVRMTKSRITKVHLTYKSIQIPDWSNLNVTSFSNQQLTIGEKNNIIYVYGYL